MHHSPNPRRSATTLAAAVLLALACSRTIEEDEPPELVESRIEPCHGMCTMWLDPECGDRPEDHASYRTVDECAESCAAAEDNAWHWAHQEDGTDACAEEWIAIHDCLIASSCEDRREFFLEIPALDLDYPCKAEEHARDHCFYSTPSLDKVETGP